MKGLEGGVIGRKQQRPRKGSHCDEETLGVQSVEWTRALMCGLRETRELSVFSWVELCSSQIYMLKT